MPSESELNRAILDTVGALIVVLDRHGCIVRFNRACHDLSGYSLAEAEGRNIFDLLIPEDERDGVRAAFERLAAGDFPGRHENCWRIRSGEHRRIAWRNTCILDETGMVDYVVGTGLDVTEERRAQAEKREVEERLRESESASRELLETASQGIVAIDQDQRIVRANALVCHMFGYSRKELLGQKLDILIPADERQVHSGYVAGFSRHPERRPMGRGRDLMGLRKDGSLFPIEVGLSSVELDHLALSVAFISDISERKGAERQIAEQNERLRDLTKQLTARAEEESRKWARELHDVYSQRLVGIAMALGQLSGGVGPELTGIEEQARALAEDIHDLSRRMHPTVLHDLGLVPALRSEAFNFQRESGIAISFEATGVPGSLPDDIATCFYRVVQETLRNIRKHSRARSAAISLKPDGDALVLEIEDAGDGFDLDQALRKGGLGLISMEERVLGVGGEFSVRSTPGKGTSVHVSVPIGQ